MEYMDFYDALRIVDGTNRKLRYNGDKWFKLDNSSIALIGLWNNKWWPTPEQPKEKARKKDKP